MSFLGNISLKEFWKRSSFAKVMTKNQRGCFFIETLCTVHIGPFTHVLFYLPTALTLNEVYDGDEASPKDLQCHMICCSGGGVSYGPIVLKFVLKAEVLEQRAHAVSAGPCVQ